MFKLGVVQQTWSPYNFLLVLATKKDGLMRLCVNLKPLNNVTVEERMPLPTFEDVTDPMVNTKWFSGVDGWCTYWQMPVAEESQGILVFTVPGVRGEQYKFLGCPFGPTNAPGHS